jgi:hypothetical protein
VHFDKNASILKKISSSLLQRCSCKFRSRRIGSWYAYVVTRSMYLLTYLPDDSTSMNLNFLCTFLHVPNLNKFMNAAPSKRLRNSKITSNLTERVTH